MATRKDVAELAGVSPAVVSYVLNNSNYVAEEKRIAVLKAVKELNYHPSYLGRMLKSQKTENLGLICDDIRSELFAEITFFSEKYAYERGYSLFLCMSHQEDAFLHRIVDHRLDGVFIGTSIYTTKQINMIAESGIPVVLYKAHDYEGLDKRVKCLRVDYEQAAFILTERLIGKGFEQIGFFPPYRSKIDSLGESDYRYKGYLKALRKYGLETDPYLVSFQNEDYALILKKAEQDCRRSLDKYGRYALVAGNDYLAIHIMEHLKKCGLYDSEKVAIAGMDNTASASTVTPSLTTVGFSKEDIGRVVIDLLTEEKEREDYQKDIPVYLVEGQSG